MPVNQIIDLIETSVSDFNESIPKIQKQLFDELTALSSELDKRNGFIVISAKNVRLIGQIKNRFDRLITKNKAYNERVKQFLKTFTEVTKLQVEYFNEEYNLSAPQILQSIREDAISSTIDNLKGAGMKSAVLNPIRQILKSNITGGAKYTDLVAQLRETMLDTKTGEGKLVRHAKTYTTTALNTFARENISAITKPLPLKWYRYVGKIMDTSREFCVAMHEKQYFHISEIPKLIGGDFKEFKDVDGKINPKNGLPYGFMDGTTASNFLTQLGGWGCEHQAIPVDEIAVPENIKEALV